MIIKQINEGKVFDMKGTEQSKQKIITCIFINIVGHSYKTKSFFFNAVDDVPDVFVMDVVNKYLQIFMAHKLVIFSQFLQKDKYGTLILPLVGGECFKDCKQSFLL